MADGGGNKMWEDLDRKLSRPRLVETETISQEEEGAEVEAEALPCPDPPDWMNFEAKCEWLRTAPSLWEKGKLVGGVVSLLETYCATIALLREAEAMLQADGMIVKGRPHPAFKMMMDAVRESRGLAVELKFTREDKASEAKAEEEEKLANDWRNSGLLA